MEGVMPEIQWAEIASNLVHLAAAYLLALPVAFNREKHARSAGLRTFPLVALASCGYMLIGIQVLDETGAEARAMMAVITGMGFIGGGAILKSKETVIGTATAASLWNTGAIGLAVAWSRFEIAVLLSALNFLTLLLVSPMKEIIAEQENE